MGASAARRSSRIRPDSGHRGQRRLVESRGAPPQRPRDLTGGAAAARRDRDAVRRRHLDDRHAQRLSPNRRQTTGFRRRAAPGHRREPVHRRRSPRRCARSHGGRAPTPYRSTALAHRGDPRRRSLEPTGGHNVRRLGTRVIGIAERALWADERIDPAPRLSVVGRQRITGVQLQRSTGDVTVGCDALVLSGDPRPNRNVAGALTEGDDNVVFHQPVRPAGPEDRFRAGSAAMRAWLQSSGGFL